MGHAGCHGAASLRCGQRVRPPLGQHDRPIRSVLHRYDGTLPPAGAEGNFIIGPTHTAAPGTVAQDNVPHGTVSSFTISSKDSVIYNPGMVRDDPPNCRNGSIYASQTAPGDRSNLIVPTSHPGSWTRTIDVYVPTQYVHGMEAPFIVFGDGGSTGAYPGRDLFTTLDNLIQQHRVPSMIAIRIGAGGQDAQGSERGREYDAVSGTYAEWVEREGLPLVEQHSDIKLTKKPDGRATMGISSSGAAAFTMAWFHPELYHRVLAYSPTMVNQQWPHDTSLRGGAWEYHGSWAGPAGPNLTVSVNTVTLSEAPGGSPLIPNGPQKPIRLWVEVSDQDLFYLAAVIPDGMHDWVLADEGMARGSWRPRATITSSCSREMPSTSIGRRWGKPCHWRSNGSGRPTRLRSGEPRSGPKCHRILRHQHGQRLVCSGPTSAIAIVRGQMALHLHRIVQDTADTDDIGNHRPIEQQVAWRSDNPFENARPLSAVAQVVAADRGSELGPGRAARPFRVGCDITQCRDQQRLITPARCVTEPILGPDEHGDDVGLGRSGKPNHRHFY